MGGNKVFKYLIVIEKAQSNFSAHCPDLPGCVATGTTIKETLNQMKNAIQFHIEGLKSEDLPIPKPSSKVEYVEVSI